VPRRAVAVAIAVLLVVAGAAGCSSGKPSYGSGTRAMFLQSCDPDKAGGDRDAVCRCAYDEITQHYSYDSFSSVDDAMKADPGRKLPDDIMQIIATCAINVGLTGNPGGSTSSSGSSSSSSSSSRSG
jgi:hypothetical protein